MSNLLKIFDESIFPQLEKLPVKFSLSGSLLAMFCLVYLSKYAQAFLSLALTQSYDNVQAAHRRVKSKDGKRSWQEKTVERALNAHNNHWEAFVGFSVAVLLAILKAGTDAARERELLVLANAFLYVRALYNAVYIVAFNAPLSFVRSAVWAVGALIVVKIFLLSAGDIYIQ